MEGGGTFSGTGNGNHIENKVVQNFQKSFVQVQNILDQNRLLIQEINQNHESKIPDNLSRNVGLIRELNNNIKRVVDLYADLSSSFAKSIESCSDGDSSAGTMRSDAKKRIRSSWRLYDARETREIFWQRDNNGGKDRNPFDDW